MASIVLGVAKVYPNKQIRLPRRLMKEYKIKPGDSLVFEKKDNVLTVKVQDGRASE